MAIIRSAGIMLCLSIDDKVVAAGDSTTLKRMRKKALYISKSSLTNLEPIGEGDCP